MSRAAFTAAVIFCLFSVVALGADPETSPITGDYEGDGTDIKGQKYRVSVVIEEEKDAFKVTWKTPDGQSFIGVGIRSGKMLSVSWAGQQGTKIVVGLTVYEVKKDGSLSGKWTMIGAKGVVRTETLTPSA
jgi:hypothetical protein